MYSRAAIVMICLLPFGAAPIIPAQDTNASAVLARMDQAAENFKGMSSDIRRVSHTAVIDENSIDSGTILLKRSKPGDVKMLIRLSKPDAKSLYFQDHKVEVYYPKIQTVQIFDIGKSRQLIDQFMLLGFGATIKQLEAAYTVKILKPDTVAGQKTILLELTPKSKEVLQHLTKCELWISDDTGYPAQQKFFQPGGDYMLVTYTNFKGNPEIRDSELKLDAPRSAKREVIH